MERLARAVSIAMPQGTRIKAMHLLCGFGVALLAKPGRLTFSQQLDVHAEANFLARIEGGEPGDKLYFRGTKDPCNPGGRGCSARMSKFAQKHGVEITYENKTAGKVHKYGC